MICRGSRQSALWRQWRGLHAAVVVGVLIVLLAIKALLHRYLTGDGVAGEGESLKKDKIILVIYWRRVHRIFPRGGGEIWRQKNKIVPNSLIQKFNI